MLELELPLLPPSRGRAAEADPEERDRGVWILDLG